MISKFLSIVVALLFTDLAVAAKRSSLYPYGVEFEDQMLPHGDDVFAEIPVTSSTSSAFDFPFAQGHESKLYVNLNGAISFGGGIGRYMSLCEKVANNEAEALHQLAAINKRKLIAPFWADIHTQQATGGEVFYRFSTTDSQLLAEARRDVAANSKGKFYDFKWILVATWVNVTYFGAKYCYNTEDLLPEAPRNTFQAVLATDGSASFAIFNYDTLDWTSWRHYGCGDDGTEKDCTFVDINNIKSNRQTAFVGYHEAVNGDDGQTEYQLKHLPASCNKTALSNLVNKGQVDGQTSAKIGQLVLRVDQFGDEESPQVSSPERPTTTLSSSDYSVTVARQTRSTKVVETPSNDADVESTTELPETYLPPETATLVRLTRSSKLPATPPPRDENGNCWCCSSPTINRRRPLPRTFFCCPTTRCNGTTEAPKCANLKTEYCDTVEKWKYTEPLCQGDSLYPCSIDASLVKKLDDGQTPETTTASTTTTEPTPPSTENVIAETSTTTTTSTTSTTTTTETTTTTATTTEEPMNLTCWCCKTRWKRTYTCCSTPSCRGTRSRILCQNNLTGYCELLDEWIRAPPKCIVPAAECDLSSAQPKLSSTTSTTAENGNR